MEFITEVSQLGTIGGLALVVGLLMQFLGKPPLKRRFSIDGNPTQQQKDDYGITMSFVSAGLGIVLALAGLLTTSDGFDAAEVLMAVLNGVAGAFVGVGGYEFLSNAAGKVLTR